MGEKKRSQLSRIYTANPNWGEIYYLRLSLHNIPGPTSFNSLKTHGGVVLASFKEACIRKGLLHEDSHWQATMEEAEQTKTPKAIRDLFVIILATGKVAKPLDIWNRFKDSMAQDYHHNHQISRNDMTLPIGTAHHDRALIYIKAKLMSFNKKLDGFQLPVPQHREQVDEDVSTLQDLQYNAAEQQDI